MQIGLYGNSVENDKDVTVREYITPAVYVETSYDKYKMSYMNLTGGGDHPKLVKVKRCVCFTNPKACPCHPSESDEAMNQFETNSTCITSNIKKGECESESYRSTVSEMNNRTKFESDSGITIVKASHASSDDLRISIPSLSGISTSRLVDRTCSDENFRSWCARKDQERKLQEEKDSLIIAIKKKQREQQLEVERENFRRWLANKKIADENKKREQERKLQEERTLLVTKAKRMQENDLNFQLWLKRKEAEMLERKIQDQLSILKKEADQQRRYEYSSKAYEIWLQQSKSKPKPIPLNRGLESLKSSASITYINPKPWVPNIDSSEKSISQ